MSVRRGSLGLPAIASASAAAAATATIATAAAAAAGSTAALRAGLSFVQLDGATVDVLAVKGGDSGSRLFVIRHLHESETAGTPGLSILNDPDGRYFTELCEIRPDAFLG
jgi:hypothetical protein